MASAVLKTVHHEIVLIMLYYKVFVKGGGEVSNYHRNSRS